MTKAEKQALEDLFSQEIAGATQATGVRQIARIQRKVAEGMIAKGLIEEKTFTVGRDCLGAVIVHGWALTPKGYLIYCTEVATE